TDKLKALILLVADLAKDHEVFGSTKLNKILFNVDFKMFAETGRAITGAEYQCLPHGPTLRKYVPTIEEMQQEQVLAIRHETIGDYVQDRPLALEPPDLGLFTADELQLVEREV